MEYRLGRLLEIARLGLSQVEALHAAEAVRNRAFQPFEIQTMFNLPPLKEQWAFPESESELAALAARLRLEVEQRKLGSRRDLSPLEVEEVHRFDDRALSSLEFRALDFSGGLSRSRIRAGL